MVGLLTHNVLFNGLRVDDLTLCFSKLDVGLLQVTILRLVKMVPALKVVFKQRQVRPTHYLRLRVVFRDLGFQFGLDRCLLINLRQVLVPLLLFAKLNLLTLRWQRCLLLALHLHLHHRRLVVSELRVHLCYLSLQAHELVINCEHTIVYRLIQIHF